MYRSVQAGRCGHLVPLLDPGFEAIGSLAYRRDDRVVMHPRRGWIEDLDALPHPAWHLTDVERYFRIGRTQGLRIDGEQRLMQVTTSRGCPFRCSFCAKDATWGAGFRARSVENVIGELTELRDRYGVRRFAIRDDNFTADTERAEAICDAIVERRLDITWEAHNGLGVSYLSPKLLERMKASGCVGFTIAVESASPATLKRARKPSYIEAAVPIVDEARRLGLRLFPEDRTILKLEAQARLQLQVRG